MSNDDANHQNVLDFVADSLNLERPTLDRGLSLAELGIGSFAVMRLVIEIEEKYELEFSADALRQILQGPVSAIPELVEDARQ